MIKFFRQIRQRLLAENKLTQYLLYAIGEIVLVVIGILIAIQVNNYYEKKKEYEKEQSFLREINLDFKSNKEQLDSIIAYNKVSLHAGRRLEEILRKFDTKKPTINDTNRQYADSIGFYNSLVWRNKSFDPKNGAVDALLNSSSFDLISNDTLRRNLIAWRDVLGDYLEEEAFGVQFLFEEYNPWIWANYDPDDPTILFSIRNKNYLFKRNGDLNNNLTTVREEGVVDMINEIIRLTETETND